MTTSAELESQIPVTWGEWSRRIATPVRTRWRMLGMYGLAGMLAGGVTALFIQPVYKASAVFQPALGQPIQTELAINNADFFGDLLVSDTVLRRVARYPGLAAAYAFDKLPSASQQDRTVRKLRKSVDWRVNPRTGVVNFTVSAPAPELAKALADSLLVALDNISISLRRERAAVERRFWLERAAAARQDVDSAERLLATYARRDPPSVRAGGAQPRLEETRVGRAVELAQQLYIEMRLREAQVAAQEARSTTALTVLRSPVLPAGPSHPRGSIAIAGGLIIGLSLGLSRIVLRR